MFVDMYITLYAKIFTISYLKTHIQSFFFFFFFGKAKKFQLNKKNNNVTTNYTYNH